MPNRAEKEMKVVDDEGQKCALKMQFAHVIEAQLSMSRIRDAGHRVLCSNGTMNTKLSSRTHCHRHDGVYQE